MPVLQTAAESEQQQAEMQQRIDTILAPYQTQLAKTPSFTPQEYKEIGLQHLEEKYLAR